jgi:hypothetical protein
VFEKGLARQWLVKINQVTPISFCRDEGCDVGKRLQMLRNVDDDIFIIADCLGLTVL